MHCDGHTFRDPGWLLNGRVPSLDGLRGISIILVLYAHTINSFQSHFPRSLVPAIGEIGSTGVDFFFVISGFLITLLLLRERQKTNRVLLTKFYLRRFLRIVPAYLVYIICVGGALSFTSSAFSVNVWIKLLTYTTSLFKPVPWFVGHTWSLSVEEHFYLIWPVLFITLSKRWLFVLCVAYSFTAMALRLLLTKFDNFHLLMPKDHFSPIRADAIAVGCSLALLATSAFRDKFQVGSRAATGIIALILVLMGVLYSIPQYGSSRFLIYFHNFGDRFIFEWAIGAIVWCTVFQPRCIFGQILNWRPLIHLGVLSYSIYLWQMPFLSPVQPTWMFKLPGNFLVIAIVASASYFFVEQPFLRLKPRFEPAREFHELCAART